MIILLIKNCCCFQIFCVDFLLIVLHIHECRSLQCIIKDKSKPEIKKKKNLSCFISFEKKATVKKQQKNLVPWEQIHFFMGACETVLVAKITQLWKIVGKKFPVYPYTLKTCKF